MTTAEFEVFKRMSRKEVASKYTKLLMEGHITAGQYDAILNKHSGLQPKTPTETIIEAFGGEVVEEKTQIVATKELSQTDRLYILMKDGQWHTNMEIMEEVYGSKHLGASRYSARVLDLKNRGHKVEFEWVDRKKNLNRYRLVL